MMPDIFLLLFSDIPFSFPLQFYLLSLNEYHYKLFNFFNKSYSYYFVFLPHSHLSYIHSYIKITREILLFLQHKDFLKKILKIEVT